MVATAGSPTPSSSIDCSSQPGSQAAGGPTTFYRLLPILPPWAGAS